MDKIVKNFAEANGLRVTKNIAYGSLRGYAASVTKGKEHILITLSTFFPSATALAEFKEELYQKSITREYRVLELKFHPRNIDITLSYHSEADFARIEAFINYFFPLLRAHNALRANYCTECYKEISEGRWELINGKAYHLHDKCAEELFERLQEATYTSQTSSATASFGTALQSFFSKWTGRYQSN